MWTLSRIMSNILWRAYNLTCDEVVITFASDDFFKISQAKNLNLFKTK